MLLTRLTRMRSRLLLYWHLSKRRTKVYIIVIFILVLGLSWYLIRNFKRPSYYITTYFHDGSKFRLGVRDRTPEHFNTTVVLLHSEYDDSRVWEDIETLDLLSKMGYRALAIDLPGHGYSQSSQVPKEDFSRAVILEYALKELNATEAILVVPSMSGSYALPLLVRGFLNLKGFVAVAPHATEHFSKIEYYNVKIPTLIIYGNYDTLYGIQSALYLKSIPSSKINVMKHAGHACYVYDPKEFHQYLLNFLSNLSN